MEYPQKIEKQLQLYDGTDEDFICHTNELWMNTGRSLIKRRFTRNRAVDSLDGPERCLISPSSVMISRALLDRVGYFDESFPAAEDYDLWLRITAFYLVRFADEPLVVKYGDRDDQLSKVVPAIDIYRVRAILKTLDDRA